MRPGDRVLDPGVGTDEFLRSYADRVPDLELHGGGVGPAWAPAMGTSVSEPPTSNAVRTALRPHIYAPLLQGRFYEHKFLHYIATLGIKGNYVDVGANIGTHTLFFATMCNSDHVYSFEPREAFLRKLDTNVELNDVQSKVTTSIFALSDADGEVTVNLDGGDHVLVTRRMDYLITEPVAVLKIDVEGMEPAVLAGAHRILSEDAPVIFAEANTDEEFDTLTATLAAEHYVSSGRVFNASPTYEFVPAPSHPKASLWTGPTVLPAAPARTKRVPPRLGKSPLVVWLRRQPAVRALARWRNQLTGRSGGTGQR